MLRSLRMAVSMHDDAARLERDMCRLGWLMIVSEELAKPQSHNTVNIGAWEGRISIRTLNAKDGAECSLLLQIDCTHDM